MLALKAQKGGTTQSAFTSQPPCSDLEASLRIWVPDSCSPQLLNHVRCPAAGIQPKDA